MMSTINPAKLADAQSVADKLSGLPKDALLYIAGYVEGRRDQAASGEMTDSRAILRTGSE